MFRVLTPVSEIPEYSEMDFVSVPEVTHSPRSQTPAVSVSAPTQQEASAPIERSFPLPPKQPVSKSEESPANIQLPEMKHLPQETPELSEQKVEKIAAADKPFGGQAQTVPRTPGQQEPYPAGQTGTAEGKPVPPAGRQAIGDRSQPGTGTEAGASGSSPYSIEGTASSRQVIKEVLPEYPAGLNKEAVIKIRFAVLADGTIGEMAPVQKGEALLEEITMRAFRQWRFNALPATAPQTPQPGIITFHYRLSRANP